MTRTIRRLLLTFRAGRSRSIVPIVVGSLAVFVVGSFVFTDPTPTRIRTSNLPTTTPTEITVSPHQ
jgi:hypothetical protein